MALPEIQIDVSGLDIAGARLRAAPDQIQKAKVRTINKSATYGRNQAVKQLRTVTTLKARTIRERLSIRRARQNQRAPFATVTASRRGVPIEEYSARSTRKGISVVTQRSEGRRLIPSAFFRPDKPGVWKRIAAGGGRLVPRLPIRRLYGPSVADLFADELPRLYIDVSEHLVRTFRHELDFELDRSRR